MKDYYLLIGLNSKEVKIVKDNKNSNGLIKVTINVNIKTDKGNVLNNNKIKILKRAGFGYKDFKFLRERILYSFTGIFSCSTINKNTFKSKNNK